MVKLLIYKVTKAIEEIFEFYLAKNCNEDKLKILLYQFYVHHLKNKAKVGQLAAELSGEKNLTWEERMVISSLQRTATSIQGS